MTRFASAWSLGIVWVLTWGWSAQAAPHSVVSTQLLTQAAAEHRADVPEFQFIREQAKSLGIRVWLFGGTAAGYGHYVKWDLQRKSGDTRFQPDRFDYDYTNIYRSTQDADLVVDGTPEAAEKLAKALAQKFPHLQGSKSAWEVRLLKQAVGAKDALLDNPDYLNQHTDSNSTGMIELTDPPAGEFVVRDLRDWKASEPVFLKDLADGKLHYYFSKTHKETARAKSGDNPEIFSAVRLLTKAFQYELTLRPEDWKQVQEVIDRFDPKRDLTTPYSQAWLEKNAKKLMQHAVNLEYAWNTLEKLGLRKKLIALKNDATTEQSLAWWLSKEPLRDGALGTKGRTAREVFGASAPIVLAHETNSFLAYESITRAHTGDPNILISRSGHAGEAAAYGDGFYTRLGREGARDTGRTIRFTLDPNAREGEDFTRAASDYVVILNKRAIRVIPESLNMSLIDYFRMLAEGKVIPTSDRGILEKLKRRLNAKSHSLSAADTEEIFAIVEAHLASKKAASSVALLGEFFALSPGIGQRARVDKIVDGLLSQELPEFDLLVGNHVLRYPWSANRPDWCEHVVRNRKLKYEAIIDQILTLPHWRDQLPVIKSAVERGENASDLLSKVLFPYWKNRPEFNGWISELLRSSDKDSAELFVATHLLVHPEYAGQLEWLKAVMRGRGTRDEWVFKNVLTLPHWRDQAKVVQLAIDLDFELSDVVSQVLVPHWESRPEFPGFISAILEKDSFAHVAVANRVLKQSAYAHRLDWLKATLKSGRLDKGKFVEAILTLPHWRDQAKAVQLALDLDYAVSKLVTQVLIPHWQDRPEFPGFISAALRKDQFAAWDVARHLLTLPRYADRLDWLEAAMKTSSLNSDWILGELLSLPHWRDQAKVVQLLIDRKYDLSGLVGKILAPYWRERPELPGFLAAIIAKNDTYANGSIASHFLRSPASAAHPEQFLSIIQSQTVNLEWMIKNLLTLPHWQGRPELIRAVIKNGKELDNLVAQVLVPHWRDRPEFPEFITTILKQSDQYTTKAIAEHVLTHPASVAHPEWVKSVLENVHWRNPEGHAAILALPHWRDRTDLVQAWIAKKSNLDTLLEKVLIPHWKSRPEFPALVSDILRSEDVYAQLAVARWLLVLPESAMHPEWLETVIRRGKVTGLIEGALALPHWRGQLGPVRAAIATYGKSKADLEKLVNQVIFPEWKSRPEFLLLFADLLRSDSGHVYAKPELIDPSVTTHPEWLHAWIETNRGNWEWIYDKVLMLPQWRKHPEFSRLIGKMLRNSDAAPFAKRAFTHPEAAEHPEWAIAEYRTRDRDWAFRNLLSNPKVPVNPGLIRAMMERAEEEDFRKLVLDVASPKWEKHPERAALVAELLKSGPPILIQTVAENVLTQPWSNAHPDWLEAAAHSVEVGPSWVKKNLLHLPHWQGREARLPDLKTRCFIAIRRVFR